MVMTKNFNKLNETFDTSDSDDVVQPEVIRDKIEKVKEGVDDIKKDYEYTRGNLYSIIEKGQEALNGVLELAQESEMPRAYEVAGQLIKNVADATDKLLDLQKKVNEYDPQLHAYYLLYSNLETDFEFLKSIYQKKYPRSKEPKITEGVNRTLSRIKEISVDQAKLFGLVFVYPEESSFKDGINVKFSHQFEKVDIDMKNFIQKITDYLDMLYKKNPPQPPDDCGCRMHKFFYNEERLKELQ